MYRSFINLTSLGGRVKEAEKLYALIKRRRLNTVTNDHCISACAYVFAGGMHRWLGADGRLGFHNGAFVGLSNTQVADIEGPLFRRIEAEDQIPAEFFKRVAGVEPRDVWYPTRDELLANHYLTENRPGATSSLHVMEAAIGTSADAARAKLPQKLGDLLSLIDIKSDGITLMYYYAVASPADRNLLNPNIRQVLAAEVHANTCTKPEMKAAIELGVVYQYHYRSALTGGELFALTVDSCS